MKNFRTIIIGLILGSILLWGCDASKQAQKAWDKGMSKDTGVMAFNCTQAFPVKLTDTKDSTSIFYELIEVECPPADSNNSVSNTGTDTHPNTVNPSPYPTLSGKKKVTVWVKVPVYHHYITSYREDSAKIRVAVDRMKASEAKNVKLQDKVESKIMWLKIFGTAILVFGLVLFLLLKKEKKNGTN